MIGQYWHQRRLLVSLLQHDVFLCYILCAYVYFSWNALLLLLLLLLLFSHRQWLGIQIRIPSLPGMLGIRIRTPSHCLSLMC